MGILSPQVANCLIPFQSLQIAVDSGGAGGDIGAGHFAVRAERCSIHDNLLLIFNYMEELYNNSLLY